MKKLIPKSRITKKIVKIDSVKEQRDDRNSSRDVLIQAARSWDTLRKFRQDRERNKRYCYGDQWGDMIIDEYGNKVSEEQYIISQGSVPLKNNLIRRLVRTVMGVYRGQNKEPTCSANDRDEQQLGETMSVALKCNWNTNRMTELNGRLFEEFLISGMVISKEVFDWRENKMDCWTDTPQHNSIFFDGAMRDYRHSDMSMIGEIHDIGFADVCSSFAKTKEDVARLKQIYSLASDPNMLQRGIEKLFNEKGNVKDFLLTSDNNLCRVIEVWRKEQKERLRCHDYLSGDYYVDEIGSEVEIKAENMRRREQALGAGMALDDVPYIEYEWFIDSYWYYRFFTPTGEVLSEGETPYKHKSHPYTIKVYPFIDGEVHSFVSDVIDQQRYVNRLITLNDWTIRSSAKGVLMFPEELLPDGMTIDDLQVEWTKVNGMILYKSKPGVTMPAQIANNSVNVGADKMLQLQMSLMEDVSGVTGALQGKPGYSGMSGTLYAQQQQNASSSLLDILESFSSFTKESAIKKVKNIQQFYDTKRILNIVGKGANGVIIYDPEKMSDVEYDLSIVESTNTPTVRAMSNDLLMKLYDKGSITVEQMLECGDFIFADRLLQSIMAQNEKINAMQANEQKVATQPQQNVVQ